MINVTSIFYRKVFLKYQKDKGVLHIMVDVFEATTGDGNVVMEQTSTFGMMFGLVCIPLNSYLELFLLSSNIDFSSCKGEQYPSSARFSYTDSGWFVVPIPLPWQPSWWHAGIKRNAFGRSYVEQQHSFNISMLIFRLWLKTRLVKGNLFLRHIITDELDAKCDRHMETVDHLFLPCSWELNLWYRLLHWGNLSWVLPERSLHSIKIGM